MFVQFRRTTFLIAVLLIAIASPLLAGDNNIRIRWGSGWSNREYEVRGQVIPTDDDRSIRSISPGGFVRVEDGCWFDGARSYEVRADGSGQLIRTYRVSESSAIWIRRLRPGQSPPFRTCSVKPASQFRNESSDCSPKVAPKPS